MQAVWDASGPVSVRDVLGAVNSRRSAPLAYTTVMTVMNRLVAKNALTRSGQKRSYSYRATATDAAGIAVREVIRAHGDDAIARFVDEARADPQVLRRLRRLLGADQ
jgi:predicted transcriptional regulator